MLSAGSVLAAAAGDGGDGARSLSADMSFCQVHAGHCILYSAYRLLPYSSAGVYRPPRLAMAAMDDDPDKRRTAKERRREREASRRGGRSALVRNKCCSILSRGSRRLLL